MGYASSGYLENLATRAGLNVNAFNFSRQNPPNPAYVTKIKAASQYAAAHGFTRYPSFVVSGPRGAKDVTGPVPSADELNAASRAVA